MSGGGFSPRVTDNAETERDPAGKPKDAFADLEGPRWSSRFLIVFIAIQLIIPLTYYLRSDPFDERFAWRMFSAVRMFRCDTVATETIDDRDRPVDMRRAVHRAWFNTLKRNRRAVIHGFLEDRCDRGAQQVELTNTCRSPAGDRLEPQVYQRDCAERVTTDPDHPPDVEDALARMRSGEPQ